MAKLSIPSIDVLAIVHGPTFSTIGANVAILGGNAIAGIVSARALGPAGRGQLAIVVLWSAVIYMIGTLGLPSSCSYHVARLPEKQAALARWFGKLCTVQAIAMTVVSFGVLWWLHERLRLEPPLVLEYATWAAGATITLYASCYLQGRGEFGRFNLLRVIPCVAPAVLIIAGAAATHLTPAEAGAAYLVPTWLTAIPAVIWLRDAGHGDGPVWLSNRERRSMWSYGWRSLASFSGLALNRSADQLVLGLLVPVGSLGVYSVASSASSPMPSLVASLGMVGLPTVAALTGRARTRTTWRTLRRAVYLVAVLSPPLAAVLPWAIPAVYGKSYSDAVVPAELLLLGACFTALASVVDDLLRAHGHPGFVSATQGAGGAVTIFGTLLLHGRPLAAVAIVSSVGFLLAFILGLARLRIATYRSSAAGKHRPTRSVSTDRALRTAPRHLRSP
jgi:O-antigen/teichoic acid export membrane protein